MRSLSPLQRTLDSIIFEEKTFNTILLVIFLTAIQKLIFGRFASHPELGSATGFHPTDDAKDTEEKNLVIVDAVDFSDGTSNLAGYITINFALSATILQNYFKMLQSSGLLVVRCYQGLWWLATLKVGIPPIQMLCLLIATIATIVPVLALLCSVLGTARLVMKPLCGESLSRLEIVLYVHIIIFLANALATILPL
jgi:hypothetical protein